MKRSLLSIWVSLVVTTTVVGLYAEDQESPFRPTPPPVPCLKFFPGVRQFSLTGVYFKMGELESQDFFNGSPIAKGFSAYYAFSAKKRFLGCDNGTILSASYMNISMPINLPGLQQNEMRSDYFNLGITGVWDLVNGEKHDIAGEIVALRPTIAIFFGSQLGFYRTNMGPLYQNFGHSEDIVTDNLILDLPVGIAAEFPIGFYFSLIPFAQFTTSKMMMFMKIPEPFNPNKLYTKQFNYNYTSSSYGFDIDLRLFRNAPDWIISVGMALAQIKGMKNGNRLFTLSIKHEIGKHYSSTMIGPSLH